LIEEGSDVRGKDRPADVGIGRKKMKTCNTSKKWKRNSIVPRNEQRKRNGKCKEASMAERTWMRKKNPGKKNGVMPDSRSAWQSRKWVEDLWQAGTGKPVSGKEKGDSQ